MKALIADDDVQVRSALRLLLDQGSHPMSVVEADRMEDIGILASHFRPDIIFLDWELTGVNHCACLTAIRSSCPSASVIALGVRPEIEKESHRLGADAFFSKNDNPARLQALLDRITQPPLSQ